MPGLMTECNRLVPNACAAHESAQKHKVARVFGCSSFLLTRQRKHDANLNPIVNLTTLVIIPFTLVSGLTGVRKSGLMGFCDVAPGQRKVLGIRFLHGDKPFRWRKLLRRTATVLKRLLALISSRDTATSQT